MERYERENLEQERRTRKQSMRAWLYAIPCTVAVLTWLSNYYLGYSWSFVDVLWFTGCFSLPQCAYEWWRLRQINGQLEA